MIPWLAPHQPFPPIDRALDEPNGLLAAGGDLSPNRLLTAYRLGIFPWFADGEPILWWSPDPRMVLFPSELRLSRSLRQTLRRHNYEIRVDTAFADVMRACAAPRPGQQGSWIHPLMIHAYTTLHQMGVAHSVETWRDSRLVGGLYGVAIGRVFFGESMFARVNDASKIAFAHLVRHLQRRHFGMIDCQIRTAHLASLGARDITRTAFSHRLEEWATGPESTGAWTFEHEPWSAT